MSFVRGLERGLGGSIAGRIIDSKRRTAELGLKSAQWEEDSYFRERSDDRQQEAHDINVENARRKQMMEDYQILHPVIQKALIDGEGNLLSNEQLVADPQRMQVLEQALRLPYVTKYAFDGNEFQGFVPVDGGGVTVALKRPDTGEVVPLTQNGVSDKEDPAYQNDPVRVFGDKDAMNMLDTFRSFVTAPGDVMSVAGGLILGDVVRQGVPAQEAVQRHTGGAATRAGGSGAPAPAGGSAAAPERRADPAEQGSRPSDILVDAPQRESNLGAPRRDKADEFFRGVNQAVGKGAQAVTKTLGSRATALFSPETSGRLAGEAYNDTAASNEGARQAGVALRDGVKSGIGAVKDAVSGMAEGYKKGWQGAVSTASEKLAATSEKGPDTPISEVSTPEKQVVSETLAEIEQTREPSSEINLSRSEQGAVSQIATPAVMSGGTPSVKRMLRGYGILVNAGLMTAKEAIAAADAQINNAQRTAAYTAAQRASAAKSYAQAEKAWYEVGTKRLEFREKAAGDFSNTISQAMAIAGYTRAVDKDGVSQDTWVNARGRPVPFTDEDLGNMAVDYLEANGAQLGVNFSRAIEDPSIMTTPSFRNQVRDALVPFMAKISENKPARGGGFFGGSPSVNNAGRTHYPQGETFVARGADTPMPTAQIIETARRQQPAATQGLSDAAILDMLLEDGLISPTE